MTVYPENYPQTPKYLWQQFYQFTQIPRPSGKEEQIRAYILSIASRYQLTSKVDSVGNVIIYVPGKGPNKNSDPVIIQNHMDMVTDKVPAYQHNFDTDPLQIEVKDGWVTANNTTLGADNGIGCAAALALIEEPEIEHPPLELLFTVDEETGLHGALGLEAQYLKGKQLINLDTEEWGSAYIGCAGGIEYNLSKNYPVDDKVLANRCLKTGSLKGGHSGIDIHLGRINAIKLLGQVLQEAQQFNIRLAGFDGGKAHNIIPRDAQVNFYLPEHFTDDFEQLLKQLQTQWQSFFNDEDQNFTLELSSTEPSPCLTEKQSTDFVNMLSLFPHGARNYNWHSDEALVSCSNNLAIVKLAKGELFVQTSLRYFDRNEVRDLEQTIIALANTFELNINSGGEYPAWKPDFDNPLMQILKTVYQQTFQQSLQIKAIHAGLECGILKDKIGADLQAVSLGPTITGAHSPTESLNIDSTNKFWTLLVKFLKAL